jgi:hypothetical protein
MRTDPEGSALAAFNHVPSLYVHPSRTMFSSLGLPKLWLNARSHAELSRALLSKHHLRNATVASWPDHPLAHLSDDGLRVALNEAAGILFAPSLRRVVSARDIAALKEYLGESGYAAALRFARQASDIPNWSNQNLRDSYRAIEWASAWWLLQLERANLPKAVATRLALRLPQSSQALAARLKPLLGDAKHREIQAPTDEASHFAEQIVRDMQSVM